MGGEKTIEIAGPHFVWPIINDETRRAVLKQLDTSISIYDRSGVIKEFEDNFSSYHGREHALLSNSGTSAIYSMFEGIGLKPGDEVICPTYTFFATASPLMHTGAQPIFCDAKQDGNIDPKEIRKKITPNTKAIIITHMWGIPCDMDEIVGIAEEFDIPLLEDCSHAHGAEYKGKKVGSFGKAAAWSLQGQKVISGGEGGIMLTDDEEIYTRAQLQGHYNKRCQKEIRGDNPLHTFYQTGFGQKFRSHPLAVAISLQQFGHLNKWLEQKRIFADKIATELHEIDFLEMPNHPEKNPSWYSFVMQYVPEKTEVPIDLFYQALQAEGLLEVDRPNSTGPIHNLPLFKRPDLAIPRLYKKPLTADDDFPIATRFYRNAIKLPIWAQPGDILMVEKYIEGIKKVAYHSRKLLNKL